MIVDKIRRYVWLLDTIYRAGEDGITFDEITLKWQRYDLLSEGKAYPKRTFEQHKEEIQETFNVEICCDRRTNRYYISDREELRNQSQRFSSRRNTSAYQLQRSQEKPPLLTSSRYQNR